MRKVVADTWACPSAGRALGPGWRTCWLAPRRARRALGASGCGTRGQGARRGHGRAWLRVGGAGSRLTMAELLRSLRDSQLVARFQRRCGLFPAPEVSPREKGRGPLGVGDGSVGGVLEVAHLSDNPGLVSAVGRRATAACLPAAPAPGDS